MTCVFIKEGFPGKLFRLYLKDMISVGILEASTRERRKAGDLQYVHFCFVPACWRVFCCVDSCLLTLNSDGRASPQDFSDVYARPIVRDLSSHPNLTLGSSQVSHLCVASQLARQLRPQQWHSADRAKHII